MRAVKASKGRHAAGRILIAIGIIVLLLASAALIFLFPVMRVHEFQALDPAKLTPQPAATAVYDDSNSEILSLAPPSVPYSKIKRYTLDAFIASEDKRFYAHKGLDYKRIAGAAWEDFKHGKAKEGASTISQQVIKNTHLCGDKTIRRKLEEAKLAKELESKYSKEKILEIYLNRIYFGSGNTGIEAAARDYFGKPAESLTLSESALLAGIIPSPKNYSPRASMEKADGRRRIVLGLMLDNGFINAEDYSAALGEKIEIKPEKPMPRAQNGYLDAAISEAAELTGLSTKDFAEKNYKIYTFMDREKQSVLERVIAGQRPPENEYGNAPDILGALIDNRSGGVCAYLGVGRHDLRTVKRQPASAIKPVLVYAPALENGTVLESSVITDEPADFNGYRPQNYNDKYYGEITVRRAVETSSNAVAVKVLEYEGIEYAKSAAARAGIEFDKGDDSLALALGGMTFGVTPLSLCGSYAVFAAGGIYKKPSFVKAVYGPSGNLVYRNGGGGQRAFGEDTAYIMTDILKGAAKHGTARKLSPLPFEVAAKTGTSGSEDGKSNNDAYCVSFTSLHTLGVWMGNSEGTAQYAMTARLTGGGLPSVIARTVYENIYEGSPPPPFKKPPSVTASKGKLYSVRHMPTSETQTFTRLNINGVTPPSAGGKPLARSAGNAKETDAQKAGDDERYARLKTKTEEKRKNFLERFLSKRNRVFRIC